MENLKNIAPLSDFDWNAFEHGTANLQSQEELEKAFTRWKDAENIIMYNE